MSIPTNLSMIDESTALRIFSSQVAFWVDCEQILVAPCIPINSVNRLERFLSRMPVLSFTDFGMLVSVDQPLLGAGELAGRVQDHQHTDTRTSGTSSGGFG